MENVNLCLAPGAIFVLTPVVALLHPPHMRALLTRLFLTPFFSALSRSGCPFAVVNEVAVLASTPHLLSAANNAQTAVELPCPTIYKLHSGRIDPGGQLASVRKERDL